MNKATTMKASFKGSNLTDFIDQKGCDVTIERGGKLTVFSVWCDAIEPTHRTVRVMQNDSDGELLIVTVEESDYKVPSVTYSDNKSYCYITFNSVSIHIKLEDEGVVVDVWDSSDAIAAVDTTYLFYNELNGSCII